MSTQLEQIRTKANLGLSAKAVWQIAPGILKRDWTGPCSPPLVQTRFQPWTRGQRQQIIAVACSPPPEGRGRWTVRLLDGGFQVGAEDMVAVLDLIDHRGQFAEQSLV